MDEQSKVDASAEDDGPIEDLELDQADAENVKGGKKSLETERQGYEHQHNETLLRA